MAYSRGTRDDYDRWANITEDQGWSWDSLYPYMIKASSCESLSISLIPVFMHDL